MFAELIGALFGCPPRQPVRPHTRNQAFGPRWSQHRPRRINKYTRARRRRGGWR